MDLVVDGVVLLVEPVSPAAVDAGGGDGLAIALGEGLLDVLVDAVPVLFDVVLGRFRGIGEDGIDEHVDAALELGNAVGWWLVLPCLPDFLGNPVGLVRELAVAVFEDAGGGGGGEDTGEFHFFLFLSFLIETLDKFPDLGLHFIPKVGDLLRSYARGRQTDSAGGTFGGTQNTQLLYDVADADHAISFVK